MHRVMIFDDGRGHLGPMTDLRAVFEVRTGMYTTAGRIRIAFDKRLAGYWAPAHLRGLLAERADAPVNELPGEELLLCVNGRWAMPSADIVIQENEALIEQASGHVVAALLRRADAQYFLETGELHERAHTRPIEERVLYRYPWDVLSMLPDALRHDIASTRVVDELLTGPEIVIVGEHPVEVHRTAQVFPNVVFDATAGPIVVCEHTTVRPGAIICGPCAIGSRSTVQDRSLIKPNTVIGPRCKIGGEVGATIFQGYANKSHDGHLGDSWVGKWANLGAGTTNSNLLNTYGQVTMRVEPQGPRHRTGMTFLGAIIGDHVKTAIETRIMTGTVLGTGSMIAQTPAISGTVPRFAWMTDEAVGEVKPRAYRIEKFIDTMRTVMDRRDITPGSAYIAAVEDLYQRWCT